MISTMDKYFKKIQAARLAGKLSAQAEQNIEHWLSQPKYEIYRNELMQLIEQERWQELNDAFFTVVPFGTGGRRGKVGIGSNRINKVTIGESAQGLAGYIKQELGEEGLKKGIVIAHDTRLTSRELAEYVAAIFAANGCTTYLFDSFRATPELSFAVRHIGTAAGVVISASHNPPSDNGFKAYWSDGGQIVPPHDGGIMKAVSDVETIVTMDFSEARQKGLITIVGDEIDQAYCQAVVNESLVSTRSAALAYSPLHGVGATNAQRVLELAGFKPVIVTEQAIPDGHFSNIANNIPNPEVPSANELVTKYAKKHQADIGITTDPDADRLGVMARDEQGNYQFMTGNQIAALIGYFVLEQMRSQQKLTPQHFMAKTIVTTDMLNAMAEAFGVKMYNNLLVGFKYIAELIRLKEGQEMFIFGGEESHGILKGSYTRDKDAAIAALMMAELTSTLKDQGHTLPWQLNQLYRRYGIYWETLTSIIYPGAEGFSTMTAIMKKLRQDQPSVLGEYKVVSVTDRLTSSEDMKGDVLVFNLSSDTKTRITVRPSGTEPKLKLYTQVFLPVAADISESDFEQAKQQAAQTAARIEKATTLAF